MTDPDIIDTLAGLAPGSRLAMIRDRKPVTRQQVQASYRALFAPAEPGDVTLRERLAVAVFIAGLHAQDDIAAFYADGLARTKPPEALVAAILAQASSARTSGPYGAYPKGRLSVEDVAGPDLPCGRALSRRAWHPPDCGVGARTHAGLPSARCQSRGTPGAARCGLVEHRDCHPLAAGSLPHLSDPHCRRLTGTRGGRHLRSLP